MQVGGLDSGSSGQRVTARSDRCAAQQDSLLPHVASFMLARLSDKRIQMQALCSQREQALAFGTLFAGCGSAKRSMGHVWRLTWPEGRSGGTRRPMQLESLRQGPGSADPLSMLCIGGYRSWISLRLYVGGFMRRAGLFGGKPARDTSLLTWQLTFRGFYGCKLQGLAAKRFIYASCLLIEALCAALSTSKHSTYMRIAPVRPKHTCVQIVPQYRALLSRC